MTRATAPRLRTRGKQMSEGSIVLGQETTQVDGFDLVFAVHHDYVYRLAHALLGHPQDAEDVTQEVFLRVYKALPSYRPDRASLRTWLTQIAVNACRTHRRRNFWRWGRQQALPPDDPALAETLVDPSPWTAPESQALRVELRAAVRAVLAGLRPDHRAVLVLHYYLDLPCPEIARLLGCAEGTVYSRLHYARRRVQAQLERGAWQPGE